MKRCDNLLHLCISHTQKKSGLILFCLLLCVWTMACSSAGKSEQGSINLERLEKGEDIDTLSHHLWRYVAVPKVGLYASADSTEQPILFMSYGSHLGQAEVKGAWTLIHFYLYYELGEFMGYYKAWVPTNAIARVEDMRLTNSLVQVEQNPVDGDILQEQLFGVELIDESVFVEAKRREIPRIQGEKWTQFPLTITRSSRTMTITAEEATNEYDGLGYIKELDLYYNLVCGNRYCRWDLFPFDEDRVEDCSVSAPPLCSPNQKWLYDEYWEEPTSLGAVLIEDGEAKRGIQCRFPYWRATVGYRYGDKLPFMDAEGWIYLEVCPSVDNLMLMEEEIPHSFLRIRLKESVAH